MNLPSTDTFANQPVNLYWFRDNLPFPIRILGPVTTLTPEDTENAYPGSEFHCREFNLHLEKDLKDYRVIRQRIMDGWYQLIDDHRDFEDGKRTVWMEWLQHYLEVDTRDF